MKDEWVFPQGVTDPDGNEVNRAGGLTKREHFAGLAMQGMLACPSIVEGITSQKQVSPALLIAQTAVDAADRLILELEKPKP